MPKSDVAVAIDHILAATVAPTLKDLGFKKQRRFWTRSDERGDLMVHAQSSQANEQHRARFRINLEVALNVPTAQGTGNQRLQLSMRNHPSLGGLLDFHHDYWTEFDASDQRSVDRARAEFDTLWRLKGLPFLEAAGSPQELCEYVARCGNCQIALGALESVAAPLGDEAIQLNLLRRAIETASLTEQWSSPDPQVHPLQFGLEPWADIQRQRLRLHRGDPLDDAAYGAASRVLAAAASNLLSKYWHAPSDEDDARAVADLLGVEVPSFAEMTYNKDQPRPKPYPAGR